MTGAPTGAFIRSRRRVPVVILAAIAAAWLLAVLAQVTGRSQALHQHALMEGQVPMVVTLAVFVLAWQVMIAAMMLPSSLPLVALFAAVSANGPRPRTAMAALLGGYALVWTGFGALAFLGATAVHHAVMGSMWLMAHSWLITGGVLATAGVFQFMPLKDRCLRQCRHPGAYLLARYRRGTRSAFALGRSHGWFCVGCCWALMLVMFAAGVASLLWMAALTALMVYEKTGPGGQRVVPVAGLVLIAYAALVLAHPAWLPAAVAGGI
jgi:predicted metal-binding membrane protein